MSDREFEGWMQEQLGAGPSPELDARIVAAGHRLLEARRARRGRRVLTRGLWRAAAVVLVLLVGGWWASSVWNGRQGAQTLVAVGDGSFTVQPGTRYTFESPSPRLDLLSGECTALAVQESLEVGFTGGALRMKRGRGRVQVISQEEDVMKMLAGRNWKKGTVIVAVAVIVGWGVLELPGDTEELKAGETRTVVVEPDASQPGGVRVEPLADTGTATPEVEVEVASPPVAPENPEPMFQGIVIDAETEEPVAGARVGWCGGWVSEGVTGVIVRHERNTVVAGNPTALIIGGELVQLPFRPSPILELRVEATTDDGGQYTLPATRATEHEFLVVLADGYQPFFVTGSRDADVILRTAIDPQRIITGEIVTADGGRPIGEAYFGRAEVTYDLPGHPGWTCSVPMLIDDDFGFEAPLGSVSDVTVKVMVQGYHDAETELTLGPGETSTTITVKDHPRIQGTVTGPDGLPLRGVNLAVRSGKRGWFRSSMTTFSTTTNDAGEYLANLYGDTVEISAQLDGYAPAEFEKVDPDARFDIQLEPANHGALSGVVLDPWGRPLAGAQVQAIRRGIGYIRSHRAETDENGAFLLENLQPGQYRVTAHPLADGETVRVNGPMREPVGARHIGVEKEGVVVEPGSETEGLELAVADGTEVSGVYRDDDGTPVAGERIALYRPDLLGGDHELIALVLTADDGSYSFQGVGSGSFAVAVERVGKYKLTRVDGRNPVEVDLGGEASTLVGQILRDNAPVPNATIAVARFEQGSLDSKIEHADDAGEYQIDGLARGRYLVHVLDHASGAVMMTTTDVGEGESELALHWPTAAVTVRLPETGVPAGTELVLTMVEVDGIPLGEPIPASYTRIAVATTSDGRTCRFQGIARGRYRVTTVGDEPRTTAVFDVRGFDMEVELTPIGVGRDG